MCALTSSRLDAFSDIVIYCNDNNFVFGGGAGWGGGAGHFFLGGGGSFYPLNTLDRTLPTGMFAAFFYLKCHQPFTFVNY